MSARVSGRRGCFVPSLLLIVLNELTCWLDRPAVGRRAPRRPKHTCTYRVSGLLLQDNGQSMKDKVSLLLPAGNMESMSSSRHAGLGLGLRHLKTHFADCAFPCSISLRSHYIDTPFPCQPCLARPPRQRCESHLAIEYPTSAAKSQLVSLVASSRCQINALPQRSTIRTNSMSRSNMTSRPPTLHALDAELVGSRVL
jgi:hypothetical protein